MLLFHSLLQIVEGNCFLPDLSWVVVRGVLQFSRLFRENLHCYYCVESNGLKPSPIMVFMFFLV